MHWKILKRKKIVHVTIYKVQAELLDLLKNETTVSMFQLAGSLKKLCSDYGYYTFCCIQCNTDIYSSQVLLKLLPGT